MKKALILFLPFVVLCFSFSVLYADGTMEKIEKTGRFVVGARDAAIPFAYFDENNERVGFSIDMAKEFHRALEQELGRSIRLIFKTSTPKTRIPLVANGTFDIECGSTTHTVAREDTVDFSITVFLTGTQLLVKKGSNIWNVKDLAGKKVGAAQGSTNEKAIRDLNTRGEINPPARLIVFQEHSRGFLALQQGMLDAYCTDGILLSGLKAKAARPDDFVLIGDLLTYDPYAYIVREDDSNFCDFINAQIIQMVKDGKFFRLYEKWFGPNGVVPYPVTKEFQILMNLQSWP
jgi:polar amino acid transport system substrate-binding protein/glutamate/aspartate transport system substrate-binding protein